MVRAWRSCINKITLISHWFHQPPAVATAISTKEKKKKKPTRVCIREGFGSAVVASPAMAISGPKNQALLELTNHRTAELAPVHPPAVQCLRVPSRNGSRERLRQCLRERIGYSSVFWPVIATGTSAAFDVHEWHPYPVPNSEVTRSGMRPTPQVESTRVASRNPEKSGQRRMEVSARDMLSVGCSDD
jgi:hypothetical protein